MEFHDVSYDNITPIDAYGPGFFRLAGQVFHGPILVLPGGVSAWGGYAEPRELLLVAGQIDVLLVGTGAEITHLPVGFRTPLEAAGIGVEQMASPAACRTYNVLIAEGRRVGLALLPV